MKKILILANHDLGLHHFRLELIEALLREGYAVYISCPAGVWIDSLVALGCTYIEATFDRRGMNPLDEWKLYRYYLRILREVRPLAVLSYTVKPNIYGGLACRRLRIPLVANITGLGTALEGGGPVALAMMTLYREALRRAQTVFFQNGENRDFFLRKNIATGVCAMLPGSGVNLERHVPLAYPAGGTTAFAFISRIMKEKGIDEYLRAAEYFHARGENVRFHVCGFNEQAYEDEIKALHDRGVITYHGVVSDVREILLETHCSVLPSYHEGMSNVLLESAACARPVITTDRSGCREIVDDGVSGFIVPAQSAQALIGSMERFLSLDDGTRRRMGLAGRKKVEAEFDRRIVVDKYLAEVRKAGEGTAAR